MILNEKGIGDDRVLRIYKLIIKLGFYHPQLAIILLKGKGRSSYGFTHK